MPLVEANYQTQPDHPSRMPLAKTNQQSQPDHPSRMPLALKLINNHNPIIHLRCH